MKAAASLACLLLISCGGSAANGPATEGVTPTAEPSESAPASDDLIAASVASTQRPEADRARDAHRHPAETMRFVGVEPGMTIVDVMAGGGYYTELLAGAVGPEGAVHAQNTPAILEKFAEKPISERLARMGKANVTRLDAELEALNLPAGSIDVAFMGLFYHDTFWMEVDRAKMNQGIFAGLKPGGVYVVTDHLAEAGSKDRDVKTLHRIDPEIVKAEVIAAGFEFVGESDVLSHPEDARTLNVFDAAIRGKTDRFVYKFRKPN